MMGRSKIYDRGKPWDREKHFCERSETDLYNCVIWEQLLRLLWDKGSEICSKMPKNWEICLAVSLSRQLGIMLGVTYTVGAPNP